MPRFHFNVYDGISEPDRKGTDLPDWEEARTQAIRLAGSILKDDTRRFAFGETWRMEVTDETGLVLFRLDFSVVESPAMLYVARHRPA